MIIAIGNAPSSGSSFLADLVDSLPYAVCGPEIHLFSVKDFFSNYDKVKRQRYTSAKCPACYSFRMGLLLSELHAYGLNWEMIRRFLAESADFPAFCQKFFEHFAGIRGKDASLFFEKSPQNIHNAKLFLETFPGSVFVHIVRNPLYIYSSLRKRNFPPYIAAMTWLIDEAAAFQLRDHPGFYTIYYEDLVLEPYKTVTKFCNHLGYTMSEPELAQLYKENKYRALFTKKISSWTVNEYGKIENANKKQITDEDLRALSYMYQSRITDGYAEIFNLPPLLFSEVSQTYDYQLWRLVNKSYTLPNWPDFQSIRLLFRKWRMDFIRFDAKIRDLLFYLQPSRLS